MVSVSLVSYMEHNELELNQFRAELLSAVKVPCEMFSCFLCVFVSVSEVTERSLPISDHSIS